MTRTQLYLPESQYGELKKLASQQGKTFAALIREFVEEKLRERKAHKPRGRSQGVFANMARSLKHIERWKEQGVVRDGSVHHDRFLYTQS